MSDQNVASIFTYLLEAVIEYGSLVCTRIHNIKSVDRRSLLGVMWRTSQPQINVLFALKLSILARRFKDVVLDVVRAGESNAVDDDSAEWCSALNEHQLFIDELTVILMAIRAHPALREEYGDDAMGASIGGHSLSSGDVLGQPLADERYHSGLVIKEGTGKVGYQGVWVEPGITVPFNLLMIS